jgi:hypothetical protein
VLMNAHDRRVDNLDPMTALLDAVWLLLDYPWGILAFVAIAALYGLR